jgi:hypothetical protein
MKAQAWKGEMVLGLIAYLFVGLMFLASRACAQNWVEEQRMLIKVLLLPASTDCLPKRLASNGEALPGFRFNKSTPKATPVPPTRQSPVYSLLWARGWSKTNTQRVLAPTSIFVRALSPASRYLRAAVVVSGTRWRLIIRPHTESESARSRKAIEGMGRSLSIRFPIRP